ncbi:MAG: chromosomal replication initiator protein DnaA [Actinomycetota bacterium]
MATELDAVWEKSLDRIKSRLPAVAFNTWFKNTVPVAIHEGSFVISTPNKFTKEWIEARHLGLIKNVLQETMGADGADLDVRVTVRRDQPAAGGQSSQVGQSAAARADDGSGGQPVAVAERRAAPRVGPSGQFNPRYVFDTFVVGDSNRFAHAASIAVAEKPAVAYNPLFVYGGSGLGKTHLLHAIGVYGSSLFPDMSVRYVTGETFTNELIQSIMNKTPLPFRKKYRDVDLLLIDDIQFIIGKEGTQEEFFHTFNTLYEAHKQIVVSSDRPPKEMPTLEERLRSRFEWGLIVDIQPPNLETRIAILHKKAVMSGVDVSDEVLRFIAGKRQLNVRELEGTLTRVAAFADLTNSEVDVALAKDILKDILPEARPRKISIRMIINETSKYFGVSAADITGCSRLRQIVYPRQVAMYLTRELTDHSLPKIGEDFGGRDHTTVMHSINKVGAAVKKSPETKAQVQELNNRIQQKDS